MIKVIFVDQNGKRMAPPVSGDVNVAKGDQITVSTGNTCSLCDVIKIEILPVEQIKVVYCEMKFNGIGFEEMKKQIAEWTRHSI